MDDMAWYFLGAAALWLFLNATALLRFGGLWRTAALVPAALMALAMAVAVLGVLAGSDLAPIWVVFAMPVCLVLIGLLWTGRLIASAFHN